MRVTRTQGIQAGIAVVFLIVGILSVVNDLRFSHYIKETLPRDQAQEQCVIDTLTSLKYRNETIAKYLRVPEVTPAMKQRLLEKLDAHPLPNCDFTGKK